MEIINETGLKIAFKGKAGWFLGVSVLLLLLSVFLHRKFLNDRNNQDFIRERVQTILLEKEQRMDRIIKGILEMDVSDNYTALDSMIGDGLYQDDGMLLFVSKDDSLVYWSDNSIPFDGEWTEISSSQDFVRLKDGWYLLRNEQAANTHISGLILIKKDYPYQNVYLENAFQKDFRIAPGIGITHQADKTGILSSSGKPLFSLTFSSSVNVSTKENLLLFFICTAALILVLSSMYLFYLAVPFFNNRKPLLLIAFSIDASLLRLMFLCFHVPGFLYESDLFGPYYFATSWMEPSLGDLVINRLVLLVIAYVFFMNYGFSYRHLKSISRNLVHFSQVILAAVLYFGLFQSIRTLVEDSSVMLNFNNVSDLDSYSLLGFVSMTAGVLSYFFISCGMLRNVWNNSATKKEFYFINILAVLMVFAYMALLRILPVHWPVCLIFAIYLLSSGYYFGKKENIYQLPAIVVFIILFAISSTFLLNRFNNQKEMENRKMLATTLSTKRDPLLEYEFTKIEEKIAGDTVIRTFLDMTYTGTESEQEMIRYIDDKYFNLFWNKYEMQVTVCDQGEILDIQPENYLINCQEYFENLIRDLGVKTISDKLYYIDNQAENNNYIAVLKAANDPEGSSGRKIYIELYYKFIAETGLGYPELLIDKDIELESEITDYSYSRYHENELIYKYGDYFYHLDFEPYRKPEKSGYFMDMDGFNHYVVQTDMDSWLVVSHRNPTLIGIVAPFSYLFLFFGLFLLAFIAILFISGGTGRVEMNFRNRFQFAIISIIIISLIVLGLVTRAYIIDLNNKKNISYLTEKTYSVLVELEHKIGVYDSIPPSMQRYISDLLTKFAQVFFSDINLYSINGNLISSSRPQIFEENLLSDKMNRQAYRRLAYDKSLLYIHNEQIGKQSYLSAYIPFRNNNDRIIAYLNLPYFAKQDEMRKEIADFLSAYINIYVLLIVLAILVTLLVSRYVTQPLQLIREKLRNLSYSHSNEKIEWKRADEIGELVAEYNRTLDELARSAELLARSERESAWREMAKQVAHEIKNPLTPMKLSVQYLKKAWDEKASDWDDRLDRFSKTIIEQIDSLSRIATEFSDFAKMPVASLEKVDLLDAALRSADLFKDIENVEIAVNSLKNQCFISADRQQMLRVFNNLINNSVQAIGKKENGRIDITVLELDRYFRVELIDNGSGMNEEQAGKIFSPSFTTKTSGMGLGLAMVKNILSGIGASISFTSKEGEGTTFVLEIPKFQEKTD